VQILGICPLTPWVRLAPHQITKQVLCQDGSFVTSCLLVTYKMGFSLFLWICGFCATCVRNFIRRGMDCIYTDTAVLFSVGFAQIWTKQLHYRRGASRVVVGT